jgi:CheY-like chemotaxis protein
MEGDPMQTPADWNVIVVDDEPDNVGVIDLVLSFHSAKTRLASSGLECLRLMENEKPNLLLIDIQMPEMDGMELLNRIRLNQQWQMIPAIAVTARVMPGDRQNILDAGFNGYIPKPINAVSFVDEIKALVMGAYQP